MSLTPSARVLMSIPAAARWLAGPIFDKELRVASRQRKHYGLRFLYVCLLAFVTIQFWHSLTQVGGGTSAVVQVSRLGEAGKSTVVAIVWFQFVAAQVLAAVLLSDAISSEIRQRALEGLLVAPIGAVHIVLGKLLSRLAQLVLFLTISLPVLAVVRVWGGVPWDYVVAGLCITLSASVFAGSLSLLYSITYRHAYHAVMVVGLWGLVIWGILPWLLMSLTGAGYIRYAFTSFALSLTDPFLALLARTETLRRGPSGPNLCAPLGLHCLTILAAAAIVLAISVRRVRRAALVHADGSPRRAKAFWQALRDLLASPKQPGRPMYGIEGAPIVWKELNAPLLGAVREGLFNVTLVVAVAGFIFVTATYFGLRAYRKFFFPILLLEWLLVVRVAIAAGGTITREKEARTWPILLVTPLEDREIVQGKAVAIFRKNVALLLPLMVLYLFAALLGPAFDSLPLSLALVLSGYADLAGTMLFLLGSGLYLGTRLRATMSAVLSTLGLYFVPKLLFFKMPGPLSFLAGSEAIRGTLVLALMPPAVHAVIGLLCLRAATRRLRRDVF